jgi:hypothetical protein
MYQITDYTKQRAKKIGVDIKPSTRKHKKIDVYHQGEYIASIGDVRYSDFHRNKHSHNAHSGHA